MATDLITECPNCGAKIKTGIISSNKLLAKALMNIIKEYKKDNSNEQYCEKCGKDLFEESKKAFYEEISNLNENLEKIFDGIPVITLHNPQNWEYDVLETVTGQSITGTGVLSEFTSSFTDLFGMQSKAYNRKIIEGESICFAQLRKKALELGGNAIIGTDIDYTEVGGEKGMLMVCAAGTAIKIKNLEVLGRERSDKMNEIIWIKDRLSHLSILDLKYSRIAGLN